MYLLKNIERQHHENIRFPYPLVSFARSVLAAGVDPAVSPSLAVANLAAFQNRRNYHKLDLQTYQRYTLISLPDCPRALMAHRKIESDLPLIP